MQNTFIWKHNKRERERVKERYNIGWRCRISWFMNICIFALAMGFLLFICDMRFPIPLIFAATKASFFGCSGSVVSYIRHTFQHIYNKIILIAWIQIYHLFRFLFSSGASFCQHRSICVYGNQCENRNCVLSDDVLPTTSISIEFSKKNLSFDFDVQSVPYASFQKNCFKLKKKKLCEIHLQFGCAKTTNQISPKHTLVETLILQFTKFNISKLPHQTHDSLFMKCNDLFICRYDFY